MSIGSQIFCYVFFASKFRNLRVFAASRDKLRNRKEEIFEKVRTERILFNFLNDEDNCYSKKDHTLEN